MAREAILDTIRLDDKSDATAQKKREEVGTEKNDVTEKMRREDNNCNSSDHTRR